MPKRFLQNEKLSSAMIQVEQLTLNRDGLTLHGTLYGEADASLVSTYTWFSRHTA